MAWNTPGGPSNKDGRNPWQKRGGGGGFDRYLEPLRGLFGGNGGGIGASTVLDAQGNFSLTDLMPMVYLVELVNKDGKVVCTEGPFDLTTRAIKSDVVIADFDLPFGTAGLDFNQDPLQGIADALAMPGRLDEMLLDRLLSRCSDHLSLFAAPGTLDRLTGSSFNMPQRFLGTQRHFAGQRSAASCCNG